MMARSLRSLASCLLLLSISPVLAARSSAVVAYNSTVGNEVTWTIRGDASHHLQRLRVVSVADVVVAFDASLQSEDEASVAKIVAVVDGDDAEDLGEGDADMVGIHVESKADGAIELVIGEGLYRSLDKVRVQVSRPGALQSVTSHGSGSVSVHDGVLDAAKDVALVSDSSGDVTVKSDGPVELQSLQLVSYSSGDVKIESKSAIHVHGDVVAAAHASGDVEVRSDTLQAASIAVVTHGSGDVYVSGRSRLATRAISAEAAGSGSITLASRDGRCDSERVTLMGSSDFTSGDVACQTVDVVSAGSGDVLVRAVDRLDMVVLSSGSVKFAGDRPAHVTYESPSTRHRPTEPHVRIERPEEPHAPRDVRIHGGGVDVDSPQARIHITADGDDDSDSVEIWNEDDDDDDVYDDAFTLAKTSEHATTLEGVSTVAVIAVVGLVGAGVVLARRRVSSYEAIPLTA